MHLKLRQIRSEDNKQVAKLIRTVMTEFACVGEGYSIEDPEVDNMFEYYDHPKATFYVVADETGKIYGCAGIDKLSGGDQDTCELKKMYFYDEIRGKGFGKKMLDLCLSTAKKNGYSKCYLETVARMKAANNMYAKNGFKLLDKNEGDTGHSSCDSYYIKDLKEI